MIKSNKKRKKVRFMFNSSLSFIVLPAVIPGIILLMYIYRKDRADKEPAGLLLKLLILGAVICFPVSIVENLLDTVLQLVFGTDGYGADFLGVAEYYAYNFIDAFFVVALVEEGFKWLVLYYVTRKNKNFNSLFDGIIYAVFVSLGFAILENILYVASFGFEVALIRAVTAIPGHMFDGIIMGYYYTVWHAAEVASSYEKHFMGRNLLPEKANAFKPGKYLVLSIIMPVIAHGVYDLCCFVDEEWATISFYIFLVILYVYCFRTVHKMSKHDVGDNHASSLWFCKVYPHLSGALNEELRRRAEQEQFLQPFPQPYPPAAPTPAPYPTEESAFAPYSPAAPAPTPYPTAEPTFTPYPPAEPTPAPQPTEEPTPSFTPYSDTDYSTDIQP